MLCPSSNRRLVPRSESDLRLLGQSFVAAARTKALFVPITKVAQRDRGKILHRVI